MRGRRIAWSAVLAAPLMLAALAAPAAAQAPEPAPDEIEMEPEPAEPARPPADGAAPAAPVKDPKVARRWLAAGQQLVRKGDAATRARRPDDAKPSYENAVAAFEKSIEAGDDPSTYALLADAEEKLGKLDLAVRHYRVAAQAQPAVRADVLKKATARLAELTPKIGVVTLVVHPEGAAITLAGAELGKAPLAEPLILMPGTYAVAIRAEGFQPREVELVVEAGAESERALDLEPVKIVVQAPVTPPPSEPPPPPPRPSKLPLYVGGGAAVALLGTSVITGILAVGQHGTYTSRDATSIEREDARINGKRLALAADLTLVGGLAAGGFTAYWYLVKYRAAERAPTEQLPAAAQGGPRRRDRAQSAKVELLPWVQPAASGLGVAGVF